MNTVSIKDVSIQPSFFRQLMDMVASRMIPFQWEALNDRVPDAAPSYCIRNLRAVIGEIEAPHGGCVFQDSDLAKWMEAASYSLVWNRNETLEANIDYAVSLMQKAQCPDGYLNTYYQLTDLSKRFTNLRDNHELYCAGHLIEAAVAYFEATGKRVFLDVMLKYVDLIDQTFGPEEGKLKGYPGHEEIELALVKLYSVTHDKKHLALASYFIEQRGAQGAYFDEEARRRGGEPGWGHSVYSQNRYYQAGSPVREQKAALGHAVRQLYLLSGMADVARETGDESLKDACVAMWKNITRRQMYITGAVGQSAFGEAFTFDYDLPSDLVYGETCASIALFFFAQRMLRLQPHGGYGDICDTVLYNGTISGVNLEGNRFFYVNPLESVPERSQKNQSFVHIKSERQPWFGCACCPPNLARMIAALPGSVCTSQQNTLYLNLFTSCKVSTQLDGGALCLECDTRYPWDGEIRIKLDACFKGFCLALRLPGWVDTYELTVNGANVVTTMDDGYIFIEGLKAGDEVRYNLHMPARVVRAHPRLRQTAGQLAVMRGPVVYCLEEVDNGALLNNVCLSPAACFTYEETSIKGMPLVCLSAPAKRQSESGWDEYELYASHHEPVYEDITARFLPYFAWNNRGTGEMRVWLRAFEG